MRKITIGHAGRKVFSVDVKALRRTRLLVQANSGGGKSWLLRRMAEQLFGKVPVWIIDPEGEFKSLREKLDFVLVGKGGETPADPRSAELVANKLRELRSSVVFDLYDLKPPTRHHYVRVLLEAMMNAPKQLWTPVILKVDEAHMFAPEKGQGESEAFAAMQDVATRGRKRGICMAAYVQRLARLSKTVSAELLNRLVGMTFEDVDVDRAEGVLSVSKADREKFRVEIKHLHAGQFYGLGPAIAKDRTLIEVGDVLTTHPDADDDTQLSIEPPPPTDKIKALLPKLQDLPKEAEAKAKTEGELRSEIRSLKAQLAARPAQAAPSVQLPKLEVKQLEVKILKAGEYGRLTQMVDQARKAASYLVTATDKMEAASRELGESERRALAAADQIAQPRRNTTVKDLLAVKERPPVVGRALVRAVEAFGPSPESSGENALTPARKRILQALAEFLAIGRLEVPRTWVAARSGASHRSSAYSNNLGALRSASLIIYTGDGKIAVTKEGLKHTVPVSRPATAVEMLESCLRILSPAQGRILKAVYNAHPGAIARDLLAQQAEASPSSSAFSNNLGALRSAGMVEYVSGGIRASDWLFQTEGAA